MTVHFRPYQFLLAIFLIPLGCLSGCVIPVNPSNITGDEDGVSVYQTVSVLLTQTASAYPARTVEHTSAASLSTPRPGKTATPTPNADTPVLAVTAPDSSLESATPCDLASAGMPFDVSIPDNTQLKPGETFVKTWRLVNAGTCDWTPDYAVVYFSGFDMAVQREDNIRLSTVPGGSVDISLDMVAPGEPGTYQANYKLRGSSGTLFGIGPEGGSPFWVRIIVAEETTSEPVPATPTVTLMPAVVYSGNAVLLVDQSYDLDTGANGGGGESDVTLGISAEELTWTPINGARAQVHGATEPDLDACKSARTSAEPLVLGVELEGSFLCARTDRGLPAKIYLSRVDPLNGELAIDFLVWSVP
jgi:hypothetical protein